MAIYQSLYRKYRPATFSEIVGQRHVTQTLANAIKSERIAHAYLFCGPRGTGKTTTARALAMALNCEQGPTSEPCGACDACLEIRRGASMDVIEFDAASHRGVDDIEELRHRFQFSPGQTRYKVYIIDEVHQLSDQAFDMLLKVLEEPPPQVIFVLATTEAHKIKPTILSRCQRFDFHRINAHDMQERLKVVCEREGLAIEETALALLAHASEGAARDALSLLEQASAFTTGAITTTEVRAILGGIEPDLLIEFADVLASQRVDAAFELIERVIADGKDPVQLLKELMKYLRDLLVIRITDRGRADELVQVELFLPQEYLPRVRQQAKVFTHKHLLETLDLISHAEAEMRFSGQQRLMLELFAARACGLAADKETVVQEQSIAQTPAQGSQPPAKKEIPVTVTHTPKAEPPKQAPVEAATVELAEVKERWPEVLEQLKRDKLVRLRALAQDAVLVKMEGNLLTLGFVAEFNYDLLNRPDSKAQMAAVLEKVFKQKLQLTCLLKSRAEGATPPRPKAPPERAESGFDDGLLADIQDMFPGSEVL